MATEQMNISLPPRMAKFIRGKVKAGEYTNASEVVRDALRHMQAADEDRKRRSATGAVAHENEAMIREVQAGAAQLENGEYLELSGDGELKAYFADVVRRGKERESAGKGRNGRG